MSRSIGDRLPDGLFALMDGARIDELVGFTPMLLTTDEDGSVSVALLSVGEVLAIDRSCVRLALWPGTTATSNLVRDRRATLGMVHEGSGYYIKARFRRGEDIFAGGANHAYFSGRIFDVLQDRVTYADLTSGVTFELPDRDPVISRWHATVDALRAAPEPSAI